jgi:hypothetical protein
VPPGCEPEIAYCEPGAKSKQKKNQYSIHGRRPPNSARAQVLIQNQTTNRNQHQPANQLRALAD